MPVVVYRFLVLGITAIAVAAPLSLVVYQSFLTAPFFDRSAKLSMYAYGFVFLLGMGTLVLLLGR